MSDHYLYAVTAACPYCYGVTQFVMIRGNPAAAEVGIPPGKKHCPECGVNFDVVDQGWDIRSEHRIETVTAGGEEVER